MSLKESGSNFIGKAKILNTPMGQIASSLIGEGVGVAGGSIGARCTGAGAGGGVGGAGVGGTGVGLLPPPNIELISEPHIILIG